MLFRDLNIGQTFDFIGPNLCHNSFWKRCRKISSREYREIDPLSEIVHRVGSTCAKIFHVK